ncbi:Uncharacterized protein Fot_42442 [Forsythia ovata]|uniref:Uncharacterized protein n=1 Tax=Forsythia ovata TaxID=205694 RepID=A0ABD1RL68_9LAMI
MLKPWGMHWLRFAQFVRQRSTSICSCHSIAKKEVGSSQLKTTTDHPFWTKGLKVGVMIVIMVNDPTIFDDKPDAKISEERLESYTSQFEWFDADVWKNKCK